MESITLTRFSSTSVDEYGLPVTTSTDTTLLGAVAPRSATTTVGASETVINEGITLYLDPGVDIQNDDRFTVRGKIYIVDGEAFDWKSGLGSWNPGTVVNLKRAENG